MARRGGVIQFRCKHEGCTESCLISYDTQAERREIAGRLYYRNYLCIRHANPEKLLTPESGAVQSVVVCEQREYGRFWVAEGSGSANGFSHSSAHNAYAKDFPPGTRLVVTAYTITPEQAALEQEPASEPSPPDREPPRDLLADLTASIEERKRDDHRS